MTLSFLIASYYFWKGNNYWSLINIAFLLSIFLWAAFILLEEVFIAYTYESLLRRGNLVSQNK